MNKQEAAQYLACSVRAIERYTQKGRLSATYVKGKTSPAAEYREEDLRALKVELDAELYPQRPAVETPSPAKSANLAHNPAALATLSNIAPQSDVREFVGMIVRESVKESVSAALEVTAGAKIAPSAVPISDKLVLSLKESAALAGISRDRLLSAIESGKLKASKDTIGRGWRVKRDDLDAYVKKL